MTKKIFGWIFILAGVGNFLGNFGKASANRPDAFHDIGYGIFFLGLGIYLISKGNKNSSNNDSK